MMLTTPFTRGSTTKFRPEIFLQPAFLEYFRRAANLPRLTYQWWRDLLTDPTRSQLSDLVGLDRIGQDREGPGSALRSDGVASVDRKIDDHLLELARVGAD